MTIVAQKVFYEGRVQGVGFRFSVKEIAAGFDVCGYVKNLPDGRVELFIQGEDKEVGEMLKTIDESHLRPFIKEKMSFDQNENPKIKGFEISK
jgi:acylphosphatase